MLYYLYVDTDALLAFLGDPEEHRVLRGREGDHELGLEAEGDLVLVFAGGPVEIDAES